MTEFPPFKTHQYQSQGETQVSNTVHKLTLTLKFRKSKQFKLQTRGRRCLPTSKATFNSITIKIEDEPTTGHWE